MAKEMDKKVDPIRLVQFYNYSQSRCRLLTKIEKVAKEVIKDVFKEVFK